MLVAVISCLCGSECVPGRFRFGSGLVPVLFLIDSRVDSR